MCTGSPAFAGDDNLHRKTWMPGIKPGMTIRIFALRPGHSLRIVKVAVSDSEVLLPYFC